MVTLIVFVLYDCFSTLSSRILAFSLVYPCLLCTNGRSKNLLKIRRKKVHDVSKAKLLYVSPGNVIRSPIVLNPSFWCPQLYCDFFDIMILLYCMFLEHIHCCKFHIWLKFVTLLFTILYFMWRDVLDIDWVECWMGCALFSPNFISPLCCLGFNKNSWLYLCFLLALLFSWHYFVCSVFIIIIIILSLLYLLLCRRPCISCRIVRRLEMRLNFFILPKYPHVCL